MFLFLHNCIQNSKHKHQQTIDTINKKMTPKIETYLIELILEI